MNANRKAAFCAGLFFIIAAIAGIVSLLLYTPLLQNVTYIIDSEDSEWQIKWGAFFEIIAAFAVIGTAITLFPVIRSSNERMAVGTIVFRLLEATIIIIGIMSLLTVVSLNQQHSVEPNSNSLNYLTQGRLLVALHDWTFLFGPMIVLGPSTFMTSYLLYQSKLVPNFISLLGIIAGPLVSASGIMVMFGFYTQISIVGALTCLPVFIYEISLAIWLLSKGFKQKINSRDATTDLQFYAQGFEGIRKTNTDD